MSQTTIVKNCRKQVLLFQADLIRKYIPYYWVLRKKPKQERWELIQPGITPESRLTVGVTLQCYLVPDHAFCWSVEGDNDLSIWAQQLLKEIGFTPLS